MNSKSRREFLRVATAPFAAAAFPQISSGDERGAPRTKLGIASTSFVAAGPGAALVPGAAPVTQRQGAPVVRRGRDAYEFLEKCHALGAGGIQTQINGDIPKLRARAGELGMWLEAMVSVPRNGDTAAFERSLLDAKAAGSTVARTALLGGRRYESFPTLAEWTKWVEESHKALKAVVPILERHKIPLAIENHKDWTLEDMQRLLKNYSSEYLGVCLDFGNNLALLDDPMEMAEALVPYVKSTHVKDMGVRPYADGFLLSEVVLGTGVLDLPRIVSMLQRAHSGLRFSLEMITRDPLKVPCLTERYWTVFPGRNGKYLARTLKFVQEHASDALPAVSQFSREEQVRVEEDNVKACLRYAREKQLIA